MKDRRVTFDLNPKVKEFYKDDVVYSNESNNLICVYVFGALFITYMVYSRKS